MNEWKRKPNLDKAYKELHKVDVEVYYCNIDKNNYRVKIKKNNKDYFISERMKDGLTDLVLLQYDDVTVPFRSVYSAEQYLNNILKEKDNGDNNGGV